MGKVSKNSRSSRNEVKIVRKCKTCGDETKAFKLLGFRKKGFIAHKCSCGIRDKAGTVVLTAAEYDAE